MLISLAMLLQSPTAAPESLKPVGKWSVNYTDTGCTLSRSFGDEAAPLKLSFTPASLGGFITIKLVTPASTPRLRKAGAATLILQPESRTLTAGYKPPEQSEDDQRAVVIRLTGEQISAWREVKRLEISLDKTPPVTIELLGMAGGISALQTCHDDLLRGMQIDPSEVETISVGPKLETDMDDIYNPKYLRNGLPRGDLRRIQMLLKVGIDGFVSACRVVATSGDATLDAATCALSVGRIRFTPARDKSGQPTASHAMFSVRWMQSN